MNTTVKRSLSGSIFLAVMISALLCSRYCFLPLFMFITAVMMEEFYKMCFGGKKHMTVRVLSIFIALASFTLVALVHGPGQLSAKYLAIIPAALLLMMCVMVFLHGEFKDYAYIFTGLLYIGLPMALSPIMVDQGGGAYSGILLLSFLIIIWTSDTGAYCFGMLFGQKLWPAKLCPDISPKKSWAGAIGGILTSLLAAWILKLVGWLDFPMVHLMVMAAIMNITGVFGDLFESLWKRQFGIKDSGNIIPGHGGMLDRFDSSLFAVPAGYLYLLIFGLV